LYLDLYANFLSTVVLLSGFFATGSQISDFFSLLFFLYLYVNGKALVRGQGQICRIWKEEPYRNMFIEESTLRHISKDKHIL
jgi:hypothetical protein